MMSTCRSPARLTSYVVVHIHMFLDVNLSLNTARLSSYVKKDGYKLDDVMHCDGCGFWRRCKGAFGQRDPALVARPWRLARNTDRLQMQLTFPCDDGMRA